MHEPLLHLVHCVYVLFSKTDRKLYTGMSSDLETRLIDHHNGRVESTAPRRPLTLVHIEYYLSKHDAVRREKYLKTTKGKRALKIMLKDSLSDL